MLTIADCERFDRAARESFKQEIHEDGRVVDVIGARLADIDELLRPTQAQQTSIKQAAA